MRLSRRMCWSLGAACVAAGLGLPWWAARRAEAEVMPEVETVRLRPALVRLPGGSFVMGSPEGEEYAREDERPQRLVEVPAFSMCQTEVTQAQYEAVMGENPSDCDYRCGRERPVQNLSWYDALTYLNTLTDLENYAVAASGKEGLSLCYEVNGEDVRWLTGCTGYRLPTEAEWEYAARAATTTSWSVGDAVTKIGDYAWFDGNAKGKVHSVGTRKANPWGLNDMHGNVWEWVWDAYDLYQSDKVVNSIGKFRVLRGGAFDNGPWALRSAVREKDEPESPYWGLGFRCARGPGPQR